MKLFFGLSLLTLLVCSATAQTDIPIGPSNKTNESVRTMRLDRTYIVRRGVYVGEMTVPIESEEFDDKDNLIRLSQYGDGVEQRTVYRRSGDQVNKEIHFYDSSGRQVDELAANYRPNANEVTNSDLCLTFSVTTEKDEVGKIERDR